MLNLLRVIIVNHLLFILFIINRSTIWSRTTTGLLSWWRILWRWSAI
jgi:hypothetical protein